MHIKNKKEGEKMNIPTKRKSDNKKSNSGQVGDSIQFFRKDTLIEGIIQHVKENVAIVEISLEDSQYLKLENQITVVAHKNYKVL